MLELMAGPVMPASNCTLAPCGFRLAHCCLPRHGAGLAGHQGAPLRRDAHLAALRRARTLQGYGGAKRGPNRFMT